MYTDPIVNTQGATVYYQLPTVPYTAIDHCNRRAAATGSIGYAMRSAGADYNGHSISVQWNSYRGYWIAEHFWGERFVWARGSLVECLRAAREYHARGAKGASVSVCYPDKWYASDRNRPTESVMQFNAVCASMGFEFGYLYAKGDDGQQPKPSWWTPKHDAVSEAMSMTQHFPGLDGIACNLPDAATADDWKAASTAYMQANRPAWVR